MCVLHRYTCYFVIMLHILLCNTDVTHWFVIMRICEIITSVWPYVTSISWHQRTRIRRKNKKVTFFFIFSVILIFLCNWKRNHFPYKMFLFLLSTRFMRWSKISYFLCSIKRRFSKFVFIIQVGGLFFLYIYFFGFSTN